jgi:hypothetical protein
MTKDNLIILVHGMGTYDPGTITKEVKAGLDAALKFADHEFDYMQNVEFHEHNYGIFLDDFRKAESEALAQFAELGLNNSIIEQLGTYSENMGGDKFFYTHILDVIYYGLTLWGERLRVSFANELIAKMKSAVLKGQRVHVLGYSLGTALINDTFSKIYRDGDTTDKFLSISDHKVDHYWSIANVSRILHELNDIDGANPTNNVVHDGNGGCIKKMITVSHKFDPFTRVKTYSREPIRGRFQQPEGITQLNTHDLTGYLSDPDVGLKILYDLYGGTAGITEQMLVAGSKEYQKSTLNGQIDGLEEKWATVINGLDNPVGSVENVLALIKASKEFTNKLEAFIPKNEGDNV